MLKMCIFPYFFPETHLFHLYNPPLVVYVTYYSVFYLSATFSPINSKVEAKTLSGINMCQRNK